MVPPLAVPLRMSKDSPDAAAGRQLDVARPVHDEDEPKSPGTMVADYPQLLLEVREQSGLLGRRTARRNPKLPVVHCILGRRVPSPLEVGHIPTAQVSTCSSEFKYSNMPIDAIQTCGAASTGPTEP